MAWDIVWVVKDSWGFTRPRGGGGHVFQAAGTACIKMRSTETSRWAQKEDACGAAAENTVTKGHLWPGSQQVHSHGIRVKCDSAQLPQWTDPVALDAVLTHSCWTQINLTDYLTNRRVRVETPLGKDIVGGLPFSGYKILPTWIRGSERIIDVKQRTEPEYSPVWMRKFFCLRRSLGPQGEQRVWVNVRHQWKCDFSALPITRQDSISPSPTSGLTIICTETGAGQTPRCLTCFHLFSCHTAATTWTNLRELDGCYPKTETQPCSRHVGRAILDQPAPSQLTCCSWHMLRGAQPHSTKLSRQPKGSWARTDGSCFKV